MKRTQTAPCRFCGQFVQFEAEGVLTEENAMEMAAMECKCEEAVGYRKWMQQEKRALRNIQRLFGEEAGPGSMVGEGSMAILNAAVCGICQGELEKAILNLPGGIKASISKKGENEIKVERTEIRRRQLTG